MRFKRDSDKWAIINALNMAAEKYEEYAKDVALSAVSDQFKRQATDARRIAEEIEQSD